jgi:hypothetical protein
MELMARELGAEAAAAEHARRAAGLRAQRK